MKKYIFSILIVLFLFSNTASSSKNSVKIFLNDTFLKTDVEPIIVDGRTLVPIRTIADALGLSLEYNSNFNEIYLKTPDYKPKTIPVPDNIEDILNTINGKNLLNLNTAQISRAIDIGKNLSKDEILDYVYILPTTNSNNSLDDLFGDVTFNTPFLEIIRLSNKNTDYSVNDALNYLKNYYLNGKMDFSFCIYGNGKNFYKNASISLIQDSIVVDKIPLSDFGSLNDANSNRYSNSFSGTVYFDFSKIDFSKDAIIKLEYMDGISKSFFIDFSEYI